jgi:hypothetical protein
MQGIRSQAVIEESDEQTFLQDDGAAIRTALMG